MALSRIQILPAVLALIVAAGTASAIYTPKTSTCPPETQARKQQPGQPARVVTGQRHQAPVSDMVFTPSTVTTFGHAIEAPTTTTQTNEVCVLTQVCPEGECTIKIQNGQITALRDGQPVASNLIQRDGEQIRLMTDDGREMMVVRVSPDEQEAGNGRSAPRVVRRIQGVPAVPGVPLAPSIVARNIPQADVVVQGQPIVRRATRVAPQPGGQMREFRALPGVPMAPSAPGAQGQTFQWDGHLPGTPGSAPRVIEMRRHGVPSVPGVPAAPGAPQVRTRVIAPHAAHSMPTPPAGGRAGGPRVSGQVIIQGPDGQQQTINLGDIIEAPRQPGDQVRGQLREVPRAGGQGGHGDNHGQVHTFTVPGHQGNFRVEGVPSGQGNAQTYVFRMDGSQNHQNNATCCDDCKQDGSCCGCGTTSGGGGGAGAHGGHGAHSFSGTGQIVIDTGNGNPRVIELGDLGVHMNQLHEHLNHLAPHIQGQVHDQLHGHLGQLHSQLQRLEGIEGLEGLSTMFDGQTLNLDGLGDIELQVEAALENLEMLDTDQLELQIETIVEDAIGGLNLDNLGEQIELQVQQALEQAGLTATLNTTHGGEAAYVVPSLQSGSWSIAGPDTQPAQPTQPSPTRSRTTSGVRVQAVPGSAPNTINLSAATVQPAEQPKVMLGITMGEAPAEVLEQIGLEGESAIRVDSVIEGLPASLAGLKPGSIIIAINGQSPATTLLLRETLADLNPGDMLDLKVVRGGQRELVEIELAEYDADALKVAMAEVPSEGDVHSYTFQGLSPHGSQEALQQRIHEAVTAMTEGGLTSIDQDALRQKIEAIVRDHVTVMGTQLEPGAVAPRRMLMAPGSHAGHDGQMVFVTPGQMTANTTPSAPVEVLRERRPDVEARLAGMEERLAALEARLDRIAQLLEQRRAPRD